MSTVKLPNFAYTYRVRVHERRFLASCRELDVEAEGVTIAVALDALRAAIAAM
jgi:hypothetical protein